MCPPSADGPHYVVPFEYVIIQGDESFKRELFTHAAAGNRFPIAFLVGNDKVKQTPQFIVLADQCCVEFIGESDFFEHLGHRLVEENIDQGKHTEQKSRIRSDGRTV